MKNQNFLITYGEYPPLKQIEVKASCHVWAAMQASKIILNRNKYSRYDFKVVRLLGSQQGDGLFQTRKELKSDSEILIKEFYVEKLE